jgi:hypothetical protein
MNGFGCSSVHSRIAAAAVAVFAALVGGGVWRSSHQRIASLAKALKEARLEDALAIDPNSVNADAFLQTGQREVH